MRLLNVETLRFETFYDKYIPPYAILSHTWAHEAGQEEVSLQKFLKIRADRAVMSHRDYMKATDEDNKYHVESSGKLSGYRKILGFCNAVKRRRIFNVDAIRCKRPEAFAENDREPRGSSLQALQWVWIDTCCIDASISSEVSEAINSMWSWYWYAEECYVYLSDYSSSYPFTACRWFTRGWTLQELLASRTRVFCRPDWTILGYIKSSRLSTASDDSDIASNDLTREVCEKTNIPEDYLLGNYPGSSSIAECLSWAVDGRTTRIEDRFYCLIGLLGVRISPMYGEGRKAFFRLQEEIVRSSGDPSIFFWRYELDDNPTIVPGTFENPVGILAPHLDCFRRSNNNSKWQTQPGYHFSIKNAGVKLWAQIRIVHAPPSLLLGNHNLLLITLGERNEAIEDIRLWERRGTIAVLVCNHTTPAKYYRSRCNDVVNVGKVHLSLPKDWNLEEKEGEQKLYVERELSALKQSEQCELCFKVDDRLIKALKQNDRS